VRKIVLGLLVIASLTGCASRLLTGPVVKVGMTEAELVEQMGPPREIVGQEGGVKIYYWAEYESYGGRIHAEAYATRDGKVVNEPTLVKDRVPDNVMPRFWN
jgi:hypothetical protein